MTETPAPKHWSHARPWHTNVALLLIGVALFSFTRQTWFEFDNFWIGYSGCSSSMAVLFLASCWLAMTRPVDRFTFPIILIVGGACRLFAIFGDPIFSSDIYRYVWDGIVQHAHINPFRYVPGDIALLPLREPNNDVYALINRREYAHTIYPPAAQAYFYLVTFFGSSVTCMKAFMVLCEGLTVWGLVKMLKLLGYRREQVLLYWWCPLLIWEIGGNGHLDAVAGTLIVLAMLFRFRMRPVLTGLFLGLAVITKMYPLILFPALYRRGDWKMPATMTAVIVFGYTCYSSVGMMVFGFLGGYAKEEGLETGARYFLLEWAQGLPGLHNLPPLAFMVFSAAVFALISLWAWNTCCRQPEPSSQAMHSGGSGAFRLNSSDFLSGQASFLGPAFALAAALMFLFSPHYAWYIAWLFPFFCLQPTIPMATYLMGFFYGYTTWLADPGPKMFLLNERLYGATLLALLVHLGLKAWPVYRANFLATPHFDGHVSLQSSTQNPTDTVQDFPMHPEPYL